VNFELPEQKTIDIKYINVEITKGSLKRQFFY